MRAIILTVEQKYTQKVEKEVHLRLLATRLANKAEEKAAKRTGRSARPNALEPVEGLEPTTSCLQNSCSTN